LRRLARPIAPKASLARSFREILAGAIALACLSALFFGVLYWRVNTPEQHLDFGHVGLMQASGRSNE
jgi:hypothetical protein